MIFRYSTVVKNWTKITGIKGPSARYLHAAASWGNSMFLFGGFTFSMTVSNELWKLSVDESPQYRKCHAGVNGLCLHSIYNLCYGTFLTKCFFYFVSKLLTTVIEEVNTVCASVQESALFIVIDLLVVCRLGFDRSIR